LLKKLFGKKDGSPEHQYTIDDLIVLERYAEAEQRIHADLKFRPNDLNLHLKLADVYVGLRNVAKAIDEYGWVADKYASDGFHDRAIAVLTKARKLNPMDDTLAGRIDRLEASRKLEHSRTLALEGFLQGDHAKGSHGTAVVEFQSIWRQLMKSRLLRDLSGDQLKLVFQGVGLVYLEPGQTVMDRGSRDEALFVVVSGEVVTSILDSAGNTIDVRSFAPGQIFGEASLFEHRAWPASYRAKAKVTLLKLTAAGLQVCLTGNPDPRGFLEVMRREMADRDVAASVARLETRA
jgi:CRP-like cAMP-binding protein